MRTAHINPSIVRTNAILSIDSEHRQIAQLAGTPHPPESVSALRTVGAAIGIARRAKDTRNVEKVMPTGKRSFLNIWGENASIVELRIGEFLKLTILTLLKNFALHTGNIQRQSGFLYGKKRRAICKFFVPTAIESKPMPSHGLNDIACKRIEEAYKQHDLFIAPPAKPEQLEAML